MTSVLDVSAGGEESEAETPLSVTPHITPSRTPSSTLQGSKFFPPDFNPESFKGMLKKESLSSAWILQAGRTFIFAFNVYLL